MTGAKFLRRRDHSAQFAGEHANLGAGLASHGYGVAREILIAGRSHLVGRGQIDPELEAVNNDAFGWDFVMDQPAPGRHPLDVAGSDHPAMALIVVVIEAALEDVSDGLDSAMRMFAEDAARKPVLHQGQERIGRREIPSHRGRHQRPHAVLRRHPLLDFRPVDPQHGSFESSHRRMLPRAAKRRAILFRSM